jgi:hypothetical protein
MRENAKRSVRVSSDDKVVFENCDYPATGGCDISSVKVATHFSTHHLSSLLILFAAHPRSTILFFAAMNAVLDAGKVRVFRLSCRNWFRAYCTRSSRQERFLSPFVESEGPLKSGHPPYHTWRVEASQTLSCARRTTLDADGSSGASPGFTHPWRSESHSTRIWNCRQRLKTIEQVPQ